MPVGADHRWHRVVLPALLLLTGSPSSRAEPPVPEGIAASDRTAPETPIPLGSSGHLFGGVSFGRGLRFNNPYRLQTELGDDAESLSLTATYLDVHLGAVLGHVGPSFHGVAVHGSFALDGVPQEVVTPSYLALLALTPRWSLRGRAGIPIVVEPDLNAGFELAAGGILFATAAFGVTADVVGSLFFGAATLESSRAILPVASLELGVIFDYEVLP